MATTAKRPRRKPDAPDPVAPQQPDLAPAPVPPAANDEARAAIATINTQLAEFDVVEAGLQDLETKYAKVAYAVETPKGMKEATEARLAIRKPRFAVEHARKAAKAPVLALGSKIDERAKAITARLLAIENPIHEQITAQETKEEQRKADLERRVSEIVGTPGQCIGKTAAQLQEVLDGLESLPLESFAEFRERAAQAQFQAMQSVRTLHQQAVDAEAAAELRRQAKAEEERKEAIRERIEDISDVLLQLPMCRTSARVQSLIDKLQALEVTDDAFAEFAATAREKKAAVLAALEAARVEKKDAEDARAAAPAPTQPPATPAPTPAPTQPPAPVVFEQKTGPAPADYTAQAQAYGFATGMPVRILGRPPVSELSLQEATALAEIIEETLTADLVEGGDPHGFSSFSSTNSTSSTELSIEPETARPTDAEILDVLASHYNVAPATAAAWLAGMDVAAALAQLALPLEA